MEFLAATRSGLIGLSPDDNGWRRSWVALEGRHVTSAIGREGVILAGTTRGILRSEDAGSTWQEANEGLADPHVRWLAFHPSISDLEFAGTEPAGIYVSEDGGRSWRGSPEVAEMRDRFGWFLPYSPAAGCVRGFTFSENRVYAAIEVGGVLVSADRGESWSLVEGSTGQPAFGTPGSGLIHPDVHSLAGPDPGSGALFAPTGGGLFHSADSGKTWERLHGSYSRAVWVDPRNTDRLLLGPAQDASGRNGRLEESLDGGRSWQSASRGSGAPWRHKMVERLAGAGAHVLAVLSNGELLASPRDRWMWEPVPALQEHVTGVSVMPT